MSSTATDSMDDKQEGVFSALIGHDGAKAILRSALRRGDIHIMLTGPPASGKSVALLAVEEAIDTPQLEQSELPLIADGGARPGHVI